MNESIKSLHDQKVYSVAEKLVQKGYKVSIEPLPNDPLLLPLELGNYKPDLVATKDGGGIILEVKANKRFSIERLQEIAEKVAEHPRWRFLLVTPDDVTEELLPEGNDDLPSWDELQTKLKSISILIQQRMLEPALLYLWGIIEVILRKRAIAQKIPVERFPVVRLLNHLYSSGEISMNEFDLLQSLSGKRNRVAHGLKTSLTTNELEYPLSMICSLIEKWRE